MKWITGTNPRPARPCAHLYSIHQDNGDTSGGAIKYSTAVSLRLSYRTLRSLISSKLNPNSVTPKTPNSIPINCLQTQNLPLYLTSLLPNFLSETKQKPNSILPRTFTLKISTTMAAILVFLGCIAIFTPPATTRTEAMNAATSTQPDPFVTEDSSFFPCISFVPEATKCMIDVFKHPVSPHPACCKAISKLQNCSSSFFNGIPSADMILIKSVCASWGAPIS